MSSASTAHKYSWGTGNKKIQRECYFTRLPLDYFSIGDLNTKKAVVTDTVTSTVAPASAASMKAQVM